jgi:hypothetical protein
MAGYGRGAGVGRGLGVGVHLPVHGVGVGVGVEVAVGVAAGVDVAVGVGLGAPDCTQYLPPVLNFCASLVPPQTIICVPVQTAVGEYRASGALIVLVAIQLSIPGLYLPPVLK